MHLVITIIHKSSQVVDGDLHSEYITTEIAQRDHMPRFIAFSHHIS
jgi:hypothetical protein